MIRPTLAVSLILLSGCFADPADEWYKGPNVLAHPISDSLLSSTLELRVRSVTFDDIQALSGEVSPWMPLLAVFDSAGAIGVMSGSPDYTFGVLSDAIVLSDGRVAVLDESYGLVRLFSPDLTPRGTLGATGDGPGEFADPVALFGSGDRIAVVNRQGSRLEGFSHAFSPQGDAVTTDRLGIDVVFLSDVCETSRGLVAVGTRMLGTVADELVAEEYVHRIDGETGQVISSLPAPYAHGGDLDVAITFGEELHLTCDAEKEGWLWVAHGLLGEVHALDLDGGVRWITILTDVSFPDVMQLPGQSIGLHPEQSQLLEYISGLSILDQSTLAVQVTSMRRTSRGSSAGRSMSYRTYLLDRLSGELVGGAEGIHRVIGGGFGRAIVYRDSPFPSISLVQGVG